MDCINIVNMPEEDRKRLLEASWQDTDTTHAVYTTEIKIYAQDRRNLVLDISKVFTEMLIDVSSMTFRVNKQGKATISVAFETRGVEQLTKIISKIRNIDGIIDIERTMG